MELLPVAERRLSRARAHAANLKEVGDALLKGPVTTGGVAIFLDYYARLKAYPEEEIVRADAAESLRHADGLIAENSENIAVALSLWLEERWWPEDLLITAKKLAVQDFEEPDEQWTHCVLTTAAVIPWMSPEAQAKTIAVVDSVIKEIGKRPDVFAGAKWEVRDRREVEYPDGMNPHFKKLVEAFERCYT
jgi:hypothetical protein